MNYSLITWREQFNLYWDLDDDDDDDDNICFCTRTTHVVAVLYSTFTKYW
jgi:hypothetical protein